MDLFCSVCACIEAREVGSTVGLEVKNRAWKRRDRETSTKEISPALTKRVHAGILLAY